MIRYFFLLVTCFIILVFSCDNAELPEPPPLTPCDTVTLTYNDHLQSIIDNSCAYSGCHDAIGSTLGNFTNYSTMHPFLMDNSIRERVFEKNDMPPEDGNELTMGQKDSIRCWLDHGYLEN